MNRADEKLRAAARTAADMFPEGGELPPLRLTERAGGRRAHASPAGRTPMVRRWLAPVAAAAAVIAVVGALTFRTSSPATPVTTSLHIRIPRRPRRHRSTAGGNLTP